MAQWRFCSKVGIGHERLRVMAGRAVGAFRSVTTRRNASRFDNETARQSEDCGGLWGLWESVQVAQIRQSRLEAGFVCEASGCAL